MQEELERLKAENTALKAEAAEELASSSADIMPLMPMIHGAISVRDYIGRLSLALAACCLLAQCTAKKPTRPPQLSQSTPLQSAESAKEALDRLNAFLDRA